MDGLSQTAIEMVRSPTHEGPLQFLAESRELEQHPHLEQWAALHTLQILTLDEAAVGEDSHLAGLAENGQLC